MTTDTMLAIERARWWAMTEQPFYGALAARLADVIDPGVKTACTDGRVIRWNPAWVAKLSDAELRFVLLHETGHCAHQHLWRLQPDDIGNQAGDHVLNLMLKQLPGIAMPEGGLADPAYAGLAEEEVDARLRKPTPSPDGGSGGAGNKDGAGNPSGAGNPAGEPSEGPGEPGSGGPPGIGTPDPCGGFSAPGTDAVDAPGAAADRQALAEAWETAIHQAAQAAQALGRGDLPADLERELARLRATRIDWRAELVEFVRNAIATRNDWSRCARRHAWQPVVYPRKRRDAVGTVLAARDTSGSIGSGTVAKFNDLIRQVVEETGARVIVVDCDAAIQAEHVVEPGEEIPERARGGGGTDFRPVFARADELAAEGETIAGIVYLTDLLGSEPEATDHPTLWVSTTDRIARTGRTVRTDA